LNFGSPIAYFLLGMRFHPPSSSIYVSTGVEIPVFLAWMVCGAGAYEALIAGLAKFFAHAHGLGRCDVSGGAGGPGGVALSLAISA
jgi:hypothetical protein